ncbi:hypothetical protein FRC12_008870 [Ceratobasidium sp. 428]|nr:hypothetical protein FRC12_008870 [Ceratobasidium sp. 428]
MPHKRAKRSVREAERKNRQTDLAPTSPHAHDEPVPKGIARVLGAEKARAAYRARVAEEKKQKSGVSGEKGKSLNAGEEMIRPGESLGEFNRRVEEMHRPLVRAAMKHTGKLGKGKEKDPGEGAVKRKREEADEGDRDQPRVKEFQTVSSSAPRRLHDIALAPPVLTSAPRGVAKKSGLKAPAVSMARRVMLEQERERIVAMYRARKKDSVDS